MQSRGKGVRERVGHCASDFRGEAGLETAGRAARARGRWVWAVPELGAVCVARPAGETASFTLGWPGHMDTVKSAGKEGRY